MDTRSTLIDRYFKEGFSYPEIVVLLATKHDILVSERTIKRSTKALGLFRRKGICDEDLLDVACFIQRSIENSGQLHGYRFMYWKCIKAGFHVTQESVRLLLKELDPDGVEDRKRKRLRRRTYFSRGPNFAWHIDGYDKLKPYRLAIHGCIDGFSRRIMWLNVGRSNNDPKIIANYFLKTAQEVGGLPYMIRADKGTENKYVEQMQNFLRNSESFVYGSSIHNQRIEWFWGVLRKENTQYWMNAFRLLKEEMNAFSRDFLDKSLIQYCFCRLLQVELSEIMSVWNLHRMQKKRGYSSTVGRPELLYTAPEVYDAVDCLQNVDESKLQICLEEVSDIPDLVCDDTVKELCDIILEENSWALPQTLTEGVTLYMNLRTALYSLLA